MGDTLLSSYSFGVEEVYRVKWSSSSPDLLAAGKRLTLYYRIIPSTWTFFNTFNCLLHFCFLVLVPGSTDAGTSNSLQIIRLDQDYVPSLVTSFRLATRVTHISWGPTVMSEDGKNVTIRIECALPDVGVLVLNRLMVLMFIIP
jgi:hypothetical protein